jgi:hypothetical protein
LNTAKVGIFEEVHEDDEFAHDGGEGGLAMGAEALIEGFQDRVVDAAG